jgi:hypothetical protein
MHVLAVSTMNFINKNRNRMILASNNVGRGWAGMGADNLTLCVNLFVSNE